MMAEARETFGRALASNPHSVLRVRLAMLMAPVSTSWTAMLRERRAVKRNLQSIIERGSDVVPMELESYLDRIHFYLVYSGFSDRPIQELVADVYRLSIKDLHFLSPNLLSNNSILSDRILAPKASATAVRPGGIQLKPGPLSPSAVTVPKRRVRVGFISKYFGIFEPHGLLLDGVMRYLPRDLFEVSPSLHTAGSIGEGIVNYLCGRFNSPCCWCIT